MAISTTGTLQTITTVWEGVVGAPYYTKLHFKNSGPVPDSFVEAMNDFLTLHQEKWPVGLTWTTTATEELDIATGAVTGYGDTTTLTGAASGTTGPLPWRTQALMRLRTGEYTAGRELRGRIFWPAMTENMNTDGRFEEGYRSGFASSFNETLDTGIDPDPGFQSTLSVYSRTHHASAYVSGVTVAAQWSSLRSRGL